MDTLTKLAAFNEKQPAEALVARLLALFMPEMKIVRAEGGKVRDVSGRHDEPGHGGL